MLCFRSVSALTGRIQQSLSGPPVLRTALSLSSKHGASKSFLPKAPQQSGVRYGSTSFFGHLTAESLWKSATSVSNAGRKRGRARGRKQIKNLNRGQQMGVGDVNMVWPGLNAPVIRGRDVVRQQELPPDPTRKEKLYKLRDSIEKFRQLKINPLERGWTGTKMPGRSIGPPDPKGDEKFDEFDCKVLEMKQVANMTGTIGRRRRFSVLAVTGNRNGLVGLSLSKAIDSKVAMRRSKERSIKKLRFIERFEDRTVYHDFQFRVNETMVFVERRPAGFGLRAHRAIRTICEVIGIKDIYCKVEGSTKAVQKIVKAFIGGLEKQEVHSDIAERKRLHVVEMSQDTGFFPKVLASPKLAPVRTSEAEIEPNEVVNFNDLYTHGKERLMAPKKPPFYHKLPSWQKKLKELERERGWQVQRLYHWMQMDLKTTAPNRPEGFYHRILAPDHGHLPHSYVPPNPPSPWKKGPKAR